MDPFTALGLAGNILQFIDFTFKVLSQAAEISHAGSATSTSELANVTRDFDILARKLAAGTQTGKPSCLTQDDQAIYDISQDCARLSTELSVALRKVIGRPGQHMWRTLRQTLLTVWTEKDISLLGCRLNAYRDQLQFRMVVMMKQNIDLLTAAEGKRISDAGASDIDILNSIVSHSDTITSNLYDTAIELRTRIEEYEVRAAKRHEEVVTAVNKHLSTTKIPADQPDDLPELGEDSKALDYTNDIIKFVVSSLQFERMQYREQDIVAAHRTTFGWALSSDWQHDWNWTNFVAWLSAGDGFYWFNGKAGSGKSTLMKYIITSPRTMETLKLWAGKDRCLIVASFYLWRSGSDLQKNPTGLFRKVLYEVLTQCPDLVQTFFPDYMRSALRTIQDAMRTKQICVSEMWRYLYAPLAIDIRKAFQILLDYETADRRLCLFLDGIDELDGDIEGLLRLLRGGKSSWVKIAATSRPIPECEEAFQDCPKLLLQDLTQDDMQNYVSTTFAEHPRTQQLDRTAMGELKDDIVERSSGVFLWTVLVVKSLVNGFRDYDTIEELRVRLNVYPPELDDLYRHMIKNMNPFYREQASQLLQTYRTAFTQGDHLSAVELYWANVADPSESIKAPVRVLVDEQLAFYQKMMAGRLRSRCCGLLEIDKRQQVAFLHRTVLDFLADPKVWEDLLTLSIDTQFDPNMSLMSSSLAMIKSANPTGSSRCDRSGGCRDSKDSTSHNISKCNGFAVVRKFLKYTMLTEQSMKTVQLGYLESLDRTMNEHWKPGYAAPARHWTVLISPHLPDLLSVAVTQNLCLYVQHLLSAGLSGLYGKHLLITVIREYTANAIFERKPRTHTSGVLDILLKAGADPYFPGDNRNSAMKYDRDNVDAYFSSLFEKYRKEAQAGSKKPCIKEIDDCRTHNTSPVPKAREMKIWRRLIRKS